MSKINILTPDIYNKISAGEVVENPVGAVKELVENSVDAGANRIVVEAEEGGFGLISVSDNGCGIAEDEIETAFLKHATSKISKIDDLYDVETLGFRGEALASISAVSHVRLTTKTDDAPCAVCVDIENGKIVAKEYVAAATGTKIEVRDLFYNTPARKKFFKTPQREGVEITKFVARFILTNPHVEIKYVCDGNVVYDNAGRGEECALFSVYGPEFLDNCIRVEAKQGIYELKGYIGTPDYAKANRTYQVFAVNGRCVSDNRMSMCLGQAYKPYLMTRKYPFFVLDVTLPADEVDVNVHPKKAEVRFASEAIYGFCYNAVERALQKYVRDKTAELVASTNRAEQSNGNVEYSWAATNADGSDGVQNNTQQNDASIADSAYEASVATASPKPTNRLGVTPPSDYVDAKLFEQQSFVNAEYMNRDEIADVKAIEHATEEVDRAQSFDKFAEELGREVSVEQARKRIGLGGDGGTKLTLSSSVLSASASGTENVASEQHLPPVRSVYENPDDKSDELYNRARILGVAFKTYLIIELDEKVIFIDQHAAHERILFEKFKEGAFNKVQQPLLFPYVFNVTDEEAQFIDDNIDNIYKAGIEIEHFGQNTFRISAVSALLAETQMNKFVEFMLSEMEDFKVDDNTLRVERLAQMACKAAVKAGMTLNEYEIKYILKGIVEGHLLQCPHGRPITVSYTKSQMDKWFKRIVT